MNKKNLRETGSLFERLAGSFLEKQGLQILEYNYRCPRSEIDIVARDGDTIVFCEVKSRAAQNSVPPCSVDDLKLVNTSETTGALEAVNTKKQLRISHAALVYLTAHGLLDTPCRFDVIGMVGNSVTWIKNAFDYITGV